MFNWNFPTAGRKGAAELCSHVRLPDPLLPPLTLTDTSTLTYTVTYTPNYMLTYTFTYTPNYTLTFTLTYTPLYTTHSQTHASVGSRFSLLMHTIATLGTLCTSSKTLISGNQA